MRIPRRPLGTTWCSVISSSEIVYTTWWGTKISKNLYEVQAKWRLEVEVDFGISLKNHTMLYQTDL